MAGNNNKDQKKKTSKQSVTAFEGRDQNCMSYTVFSLQDQKQDFDNRTPEEIANMSHYINEVYNNVWVEWSRKHPEESKQTHPDYPSRDTPTDFSFSTESMVKIAFPNRTYESVTLIRNYTGTIEKLSKIGISELLASAKKKKKKKPERSTYL